MTSRKRKYGIINAPSDNELNSFIERCAQTSTTSEDSKSHENTEFKVFNDPVHGHFELPQILFNIIDTAQFQRLRSIKQLGWCYLVFPGACHNRFEHSVGVAYLAGKMCKTLQRRQPELNINAVDVLCIQIAGLCHDLGHGPFSHFLDGLFIPAINPSSQWRHEDASVEMFDHMITENKLAPLLTKVGLQEIDVTFIKELIAGSSSKSLVNDGWPYIGRDKSKSFLYEIVANKRTGIDVDKWDYFARDCYHLGISNNFDYKRCMKFARVISVDGKYEICTRDKEVGTLYDMFHTRNSLHRRAYQHKTAKIIDKMLCDALLKANEHIRLPGKNGSMLSISDCIKDMTAYTHLTDHIVYLIELSTDSKLKEARDILQRIYKRDLYKLVGQTMVNKELLQKLPQQICSDIVRNCNDDLSIDDFDVHVIQFDYGMKDSNPIDQVRFYNKNNPDVAIKMSKHQVSQMLPETFAEQHIRFYCKKNQPQLIQQGTSAFKEWSKTVNS